MGPACPGSSSITFRGASRSPAWVTFPANAVAITGNLTVVSQTGRGFVFLGPTASANPTSSTINFPTGDTRANGVTVALSDTGQLAATYVSPAAGATTHLLLDVTGYFVQDISGATYTAITPFRVLNTRDGTGLSGKFTNHSPRSFQVAGVGDVPANAVAITGNLTVVSQTGRGFVFLGPTSSANPTSSTINFPIGDTRANGVTVDLERDRTARGHLRRHRRAAPRPISSSTSPATS